tara:strand:- start:1676 stop:2296 length:621 start_codon:yes stop_codon:yes gene_type:complete
MVSEVEYMVDLLESNWDAAVTALKTTGGNGTIADIHGVHPIIMDIRDMGSAKATDAQGRAKGGNRISMGKKSEAPVSPSTVSYSRDIIVVMETGNTIEYPTIAWDIRNETYNLSISIRTRQDDRTLNDGSRVSATGSFGVERIQSLYLLVRYIIEQKRRGWLKTGSAIYENVNQLIMGERSESNDKKNRIFGYKVSVTLKKLSLAV